jgi:hypothetical protein
MRTKKTFEMTPNAATSDIEAPICLNSRFTYDGKDDHPKKLTIPTFNGELNKDNKECFLFAMKAFENALEDLGIQEPRVMFITMG